MNSTLIRYVTRAELDVQLWDNCITNASNGLIYAYSFYLDTIAKQWDALVLDDYRMVMPLTWNKKAGLYYLYQPTFTHSLGIFGNNITSEIVKEFIDAIPKRFRLIEISLNKENDVRKLNDHDCSVMMRKNYVLPLNRPYEELYEGYNENIRRNARKSASLGSVVQKNIPIDEIIALTKRQFAGLPNLDADCANFTLLYQLLAPKNLAITYGIILKDQLLASAAYFFSHGRAYYLLVGNHPNGKTIGASHYLIDRFIADYAGQNLILDFEGSDISSLAFFYSSFGATLENFPAIKINRLPWWIRWLKK